MGWETTNTIRVKFRFLASVLLLLIVSCENKYEAPVPNPAWPEFDAPAAKPLDSIARTNMEGVYMVTDGSDQFGKQVALKWSFVSNVLDTTFYVSVLGDMDIVYFVLEGKKSGTSMIFNGYWRKLIGVETGIARFAITKDNGAQQLLSGVPVIPLGGMITMEGTWGNGDQAPTNPVVFKSLRLLNNVPFEILAHRGGGRTTDQLPYSENSVGMIKYASRVGATGIELDLRLTSDGIPVLYHDNTLNLRLIQKNGLSGSIEDYSYQQIKTFVKLTDGESIPTLAQALDAVLYNTPIRYVWLDTREIGSLVEVRNLQITYLQKAAAIGRQLQIVLGLPEKDNVSTFLALPNYQSTPALCELSVEDVHSTNAVAWAPEWTSGSQNAAVGQIQGEGRKAFVRTLDDAPHISQFVNESGFDGILSNYPSLVAYYHYAKQ